MAVGVHLAGEAVTTEISYRHGDTSSYLLTITDDEGNEVDLSTGELVVTAKERGSDSEAAFTATPDDGIDLAGDPVNQATLTIAPDGPWSDDGYPANAHGRLIADVRFWRDEDGGQTPLEFTIKVIPTVGTDPDLGS